MASLDWKFDFDTGIWTAQTLNKNIYVVPIKAREEKWGLFGLEKCPRFFTSAAGAIEYADASKH